MWGVLMCSDLSEVLTEMDARSMLLEAKTYVGHSCPTFYSIDTTDKNVHPTNKTFNLPVPLDFIGFDEQKQDSLRSFDISSVIT